MSSIIWSYTIKYFCSEFSSLFCGLMSIRFIDCDEIAFMLNVANYMGGYVEFIIVENSKNHVTFITWL